MQATCGLPKCSGTQNNKQHESNSWTDCGWWRGEWGNGLEGERTKAGLGLSVSPKLAVLSPGSRIKVAVCIGWPFFPLGWFLLGKAISKEWILTPWFPNIKQLWNVFCFVRKGRFTYLIFKSSQLLLLIKSSLATCCYYIRVYLFWWKIRIYQLPVRFLKW